ncbi:MAG: PKD domain-containing protein [Phycisphaerales bacterium]|nr:PKD domain-containing protein [Phycisphaerales bacterium]
MMALLAAGGCSTLRDPNVPEPIQALSEPEGGGAYELYRPSAYDRAKRWPLVVVCCGRGWLQSPNAEIRRWTSLAESSGFLVAAPKVDWPRSGFGSEEGGRDEAWRAGERHILGVVRHIQGAHNISDDRIFIYGWAEGALPALYVGLRNAEVFRGVAVAQPELDPAELGPLVGRVDRDQPLLVRYSVTDAITGKDARACAEWLQTHHGNFTDDRGTVREGVQQRVLDFFEYVVATRPWVHVRAFSISAERPLDVAFKARCSFAPSAYEWDFGDGATSLLSEPTHAFAERGVYRVQLTVTPPSGRPVTRAVAVTVPSPERAGG